MSISLQCAECKTVIEVSDSAAGKYAKCRKCGNLMRVPGDAPAPKFKSGGGGSSLKWLLVGGAAIALTAGGVFAWSQFAPPRPRVTQAAPVAPEKTGEPGTPVPKNAGGKDPAPTNPGAAQLPRIIPDSPMKDALLDAPEGSLATGAILNPSALLTELRRNIDATTKSNATAAGTIGLMISQVQAQTGLDLNNTQSLGIAGLDLSKPLTFSLLVDAADPNKGGMAVGGSLSDPVQFRSALKNLFQKSMLPLQQISATPELYRLDDSSCVAVEEKRVFVIVSDSASLLSRAQEFLRKRKQQRLAETEQMAVALHGAGALNSSGALYVDLPRVLSLQKREPLPLANELRGLAFAMSGAGGWFLQLNRDAALHQLLKPGPSPRALLERFETPLAAGCITLEDPVKLLQHTLHASKQSNELIRMDSELRAKTNLGLADLDEALKNSSAGFLLFKGTSVTPFSGVLFLKPGNSTPSHLIRARALLEQAVNTFNEEFAKPGRNIVIPRATITEMDGTLFATTDPQLLAGYQRATGSRWKAEMAPDDIAFLEYRAGEVMQHLKRLYPQMAQTAAPADPNSVFTSGFKRLPEGVKYYSSNAQVDVATISIAAAAAIPALLRSRMAANEAAAVASARYYKEAQAMYRRMDRDGDGVMEYAQSIGKEHGLARMEISQGQMFLEEKYAQAEGNPNDLTTPVAGYCIKLLKGQGDRAKGGRMTYITGKDQVLGHAAIFYPKKYDNTGRTSYIVNQDGILYSADLGIDTNSIVEFMTEFNPGPGWNPIP